ncbi:hypothetical protein SerAS12_2608 [Serratia sp. AS12]|uniref:hypothetical protein n=1 Tax=Serratia TaxID=613 RepID=UPI00020E9F58|nr:MULTISPECIES: hypothetical protein [Serratia]AEF45729.1 hypothetical protein SerAS9_2607 [Serratia plymuthica AS9]AEF50680.1 hypothetical protein SerAS12_2608 [Serratia sp. AS12]AEG28387.1 hypothetical protein SerAS13_2609 [Serratia sp. AS13]UTN94492.1 hypothetical protein NLX81_13310 [Serratia plymuthica]
MKYTSTLLLASILTLAPAPFYPLFAAEDSLESIADAYQLKLGDSAGNLPYYVAKTHGRTPYSALIVLHGHPRDAGKTLAAALKAAQLAGKIDDTLLVAPLYPVPTAQARRCHSPGVPAAQPGDALWSCSSWIEGGLDLQSTVSSFAALDQLIAELKIKWPQLRWVTVAGFSAGAQFVQHYAGFAEAPGGMSVRYVISDPGSWLYFDRRRPQPVVDWRSCSQEKGCDFTWTEITDDACPNLNHWKYGIEKLPAFHGQTSKTVRQRYAAADITYIEGEKDTGNAPGTFYKILDKSCAAQAQGPYRLQRGIAYAAYDRNFIAPVAKRQLLIVPGCAHDVSCVFPSSVARRVLFVAP